jgi:XapX domain-containing protein
MMDSIAELLLGPITGFLLGLGIGATCRWTDIPLPAPPKLVGALLVVAMTIGFVVTDTVLAAG